MPSLIEEKLRRYFIDKQKEVKFKDGLVIKTELAHTKEVAHVANCRSGRESAEFYAAGIALGELDRNNGLSILHGLRKLQVVDRDNHQYGGFRWYMEESKINDSNAAFFILKPLVTLRLLRPDRIPAEHVPLLDEMMLSALHWFAQECRHPILYYPNKIVSDGALLLAIAVITGVDEQYVSAMNFFVKWEDYTERRGWGWGENCSIVYLRVILEALQTACVVMEQDREQGELCNKLRERMRELMDYIRFHQGHEFVPTIRSYNFMGKPTVDNLIWLFSGARKITASEPIAMKEIRDIASVLLFAKELEVKAEYDAETGTDHLPIARTRIERIFDDSFAYTWIGACGRMGSINRFPVMPGCYQNTDWGLGWQSFPVSFGIASENIAYLRWYVSEGGRIRTHPAEDQHHGYLNSALFAGVWLPDVQLRSAQADNMLLCVRSIANLHHAAEEIADEWVLHQFGGEVESLDITDESGTRQWVGLKQDESCAAITALNGIMEEQYNRVCVPICVNHDKEMLRVRQVLYSGEEKTVFHPRLEAGWAVVLFDEPLEREPLLHYLSCVYIDDATVRDEEVPRASYMSKREIALYIEGNKKVELTVDPYDK